MWVRKGVRRVLLSGGLAAGGLSALACGGLEGALTDVEVATDLGATEPQTGEPQVAEPELPTPLPDGPATADPYSQFPALDASEVPPTNPDPACPEGTSVIRYPRGPSVEAYCATTQGMKQGPWHRVAGRTVTETREYDQGQQVGRAVRWEKAVKIAEQSYRAGQAEGDIAEWNDAGILMLRGTMVAGKRHGKFLLRSATHIEAFDGRCYQDGTEVWTTASPEEFVAKTCP